MWDTRIAGVAMYNIIQWFYLYSFLGWVWETCYVSAKSRKFVNRGFISGPLCTIYGCGALSVYLILRPLNGQWPLLFVGGILVATVLEYITAVLMESIFHTSWWDYSDKRFNFQGRICLGASLGWGGFTLLLFLVFQPFVEWVVGLYSRQVGEFLAVVVTAGWLTDCTFSAMAAFRLSGKLASLEQLLEEKRQEFARQLAKAERLERHREFFEEAGESLEKLRENLSNTLADSREAWSDSSLHKALEESKRQWAAKESHNIRRFVKSYPHLNRGYRLRKNHWKGTK